MMDTKPEIWLAVCEGHFPDKTDAEIMTYSMKAAADWYTGQDNELAQLFDQYVMIKNLKGVGDGN
jgi:hypothetical protein